VLNNCEIREEFHGKNLRYVFKFHRLVSQNVFIFQSFLPWRYSPDLTFSLSSFLKLSCWVVRYFFRVFNITKFYLRRKSCLQCWLMTHLVHSTTSTLSDHLKNDPNQQIIFSILPLLISWKYRRCSFLLLLTWMLAKSLATLTIRSKTWSTRSKKYLSTSYYPSISVKNTANLVAPCIFKF